MNAEMARIRKTRNYNEAINRQPTRIKDDRMEAMVFKLNYNFKDLYEMVTNNQIDIDEFANVFIANIYIILNMFNEMGVYPDFFYDEIVKMNIEYKKIIEDNKGIRGNYRLFKEINLSARVSKAMQSGLDRGYNRVQAYQKKNINDAFLEMISFFQAFNIPYNIRTEEQCRKVFNDIQFNHINITEKLLNGDFITDDIECLARLLFEYLTFFVSMGIYPKDLLDEYIDRVSDVKTK